jgi:hypothetical protein
MSSPDIDEINANAALIVEGIGEEAVDVYCFLREQCTRGSVTSNRVFQFTYRSFYRLDNAGLKPAFKKRYFELMEAEAGKETIDIAGLARSLSCIENLKGQSTLQFSFVTKLASTLNPQYPVYDSQVASVFGFRAPYNYKAFETRLAEYLTHYSEIRTTYSEILASRALEVPLRLFRKSYAPAAQMVNDIKALDFIFWSAGKLSLEPEPA